MSPSIARIGVVLGLLVALAWACATPSPVERADVYGFRPYRVKGVKYVPLRDWRGYEEQGLASWYGSIFHGRRTASGERFDTHKAYTAAHKTLPFNVCTRVENLHNGRSVVVRINDRGPFKRGRVIDLSRVAAAEIGMLHTGVAPVRVEVLGPAASDGRCADA